LAMPVLCTHLACIILLPDDAQGGSIDAEADGISLTVHGRAADRDFSEAVDVIAFSSRQQPCILIEYDNNRPAL